MRAGSGNNFRGSLCYGPTVNLFKSGGSKIPIPPGKRKAFLKRPRPDMCESQTAFMDIIVGSRDTMATRKYRDTYLLSYMAIETFARDGPSLLRLLHYRVSHTPEEWVPFDNEQVLKGWLAGVFEERFNSGCTMGDGIISIRLKVGVSNALPVLKLHEFLC